MPGAVDVLIAGGGLSGCLIAARLRQVRPEIRVLLLEQSAEFGGNHTWSFHESDLAERIGGWMAPLVAHRWPAQTVRFPSYSRTLDYGYRSVTSDSLRAALHPLLDGIVRCNAAVRALAPRRATLEDGTTIDARAVIDCRGLGPTAGLWLAYQKFRGIEITTQTPHGVTEPVIMDATVPQLDGYRFVYLLPFSRHRLLVEDTYYADDAAIDGGRLDERLAAYIEDAGWRIASVLRHEQGVLPITLGGDIDRFWRERAREGTPVAGLRAGLFHPTTGYSLPDAARLADLIAEQRDLSSGALFSAIETHARRLWRERRFYRSLNRMLFRAAEPEQRWRVLQRFYSLPAPLIARFYAAQLTRLGQARILTGRPPVPISAALRALAARPPMDEETA
ncbi:MAG: lycopene beta-cyclase CrtY [Rhizobiales bacterium]|nr:lycopene beta-cyclase CrtY [Hyphomicrobiales bacterium]